MLKKNTRTRAERTVSVQEREESPLQIADKVDATVVFLMTVAFFFGQPVSGGTQATRLPLKERPYQSVREIRAIRG